MAGHVLVIGATLLDIKGKPILGLEPGTSNPSNITTTRGGTARNVAENLGRLGAEVVLLSAVGDDYTGRQLIDMTATAGVDISQVQVLPGERSGSYIAILEPDGRLSVALDDVKVMNHIDSAYLESCRHLFATASRLLVDGSLTPATLATAAHLARQYNLPLAADPSSARLAHKLCPHLKQIDLLVPNEVEAATLLDLDFPGYDPDSSQEMALQLVRKGVNFAIVTLSDFGLAYATPDETGYIPPHYGEMVDSTGTGDAVTAAIIYGLLNDLSIIEAIRLGAAAASLTVQTEETVVPDLSLDMLYDHLIV